MAIRKPLGNQAAAQKRRASDPPKGDQVPDKPHSIEELREISNGKGTLSLTRIQPQGKPAMPVKDFLNGLRTPLRILG